MTRFLKSFWILYIDQIIVDDRHVTFCEYNGSVARIICVAVATLANEKCLERASDNDLLLCLYAPSIWTAKSRSSIYF
jgi:hypothetical protein